MAQRVKFPTDQPAVTTTGLYTIPQTASVLNVSRETIRRWVADGTMHAKTRKIDLAVIITGKEILRIWGETI